MKRAIPDGGLKRIASKVGQGIFPEGIGDMEPAMEDRFREALTRAVMSVISDEPEYQTYTDDSLPMIAKHYVDEMLPVLKEVYQDEAIEMANSEYSAWAD
jgi:hypothetical protein